MRNDGVFQKEYASVAIGVIGDAVADVRFKRLIPA